MPEASHVHKLLNRIPTEEPETEWRRAFLVEREGSAQSFSVSVRRKDGREVGGFPIHFYARHDWIDRNSKTQRIIWIFSNGGIYVEGQHLERGLDALEEGKLKRIQEQDSNEIALIQSRNADIRKAEDKEPIVLRVVISPSIETVLEEDENLVEIAKAIKESHVHNDGSGKEPAR